MESIFVFHGADHKAGTSMLVRSVAEQICGAYREVRVLTAALHGAPGNDYVTGDLASVESIRSYLENRVLSKAELMKACRCTENRYFLAGVEDLLERRDYFPEMVSYLLETMAPEFQIILVDAGNEIDNGLAAGALQLGQENYLALSQQESALRQAERKLPLCRRLGLRFGQVVLNRFREEDPYSLAYVQERLGPELPGAAFCKVAEAENGARAAETEHKPLLAYKNEDYAEDVLRLANQLLRAVRLPEIQKARRGLWKSFI
jgi:hypothetical protein